MAPDSKDAVKTVATWAAIATVAGILLQAVIYSFMAGSALAKKADVSELTALKGDFYAYTVKDSKEAGTRSESLRYLEAATIRIEQKLDQLAKD